MIQKKSTKPNMVCTCAHHGTIIGLPMYVISVQSNVSTLMPIPFWTPKTWFTTLLFGHIQHTNENIDSAWNKKPFCHQIF